MADARWVALPLVESHRRLAPIPRTVTNALAKFILGSLLVLFAMGFAAAQSVNRADRAPEQVKAPLDTAGMARELARLDGVCAQLGLVAERDVMRQWHVNEPTDAHLLFLPVQFDPLANVNERALVENRRANHPDDDAATSSSSTAALHASHDDWLKHFVTARQRHAAFWFEEAKRRSAAGDEWSAYNNLWRTLREDDEHAEAKRVLGPMVASLTIRNQPRTSLAAHPTFAWPAGSFSRLETANFKIVSHADAATTQAIARQLEHFHALWTQVFYPLWAPPNVTTARFSGRNATWSRRQTFDVVLCKDRADYLKVLGADEANIGVSVGYYNPDSQTSFFYPNEQLTATLYHEVTHQLLAEASVLKGNNRAGSENDFWIVEAVALYVESLTNHNYHWRVGGWLAPRMQAARYRALHDGYWSDWDSFTAGSMDVWKSDPDISKRYTHAAGLAHFFLDKRLPADESEENLHDPADAASLPGISSSSHDDRSDEAAVQKAEAQLASYDAEASRVAFFAALASVYQSKRPSQKLKEFLGGDDAQRSYVHFLLARDRHLKSTLGETINLTEDVANVRELVLTRSQLSHSSWKLVGAFSNVQWLDVSFSNVEAADLSWLANFEQLERLSLEGIGVDAGTLRMISELPRLKELDLSHCKIDDADFRALGRPARLETLWLSGTEIGEASAAAIEGMPKLSFVALHDTRLESSRAEQLSRRIEDRKKN